MVKSTHLRVHYCRVIFIQLSASRLRTFLLIYYFFNCNNYKKIALGIFQREGKDLHFQVSWSTELIFLHHQTRSRPQKLHSFHYFAHETQRSADLWSSGGQWLHLWHISEVRWGGEVSAPDATSTGDMSDSSTPTKPTISKDEMSTRRERHKDHRTYWTKCEQALSSLPSLSLSLLAHLCWGLQI